MSTSVRRTTEAVLTTVSTWPGAIDAPVRTDSPSRTTGERAKT